MLAAASRYHLSMAVLLRGKVLVLAHPRTASTVLRNAILEQGAMLINPHHVGIDHPEVVKHHRGEPVLTVIRNPYDMLVSWWFVRTFNRPHRPTLTEFVKTFRDQKENFIRGGKILYHTPAADIVLRYESLDQDLNPALVGCGVEPVVLPHSNRTGGKDKPWQSYYDQAAIKAANDRFGEEISSHGYPLLS